MTSRLYCNSLATSSSCAPAIPRDETLKLFFDAVPVVVLKTVRGAFQHGDMGLVRSVGRLGVPVYVFQNAVWAPVARSRYVHGTLTWNFSTHSEEQSIAHLLAVGRKIGGRSILIPTDDAGAILVADHADALSEEY